MPVLECGKPMMKYDMVIKWAHIVLHKQKVEWILTWPLLNNAALTSLSPILVERFQRFLSQSLSSCSWAATCQTRRPPSCFDAALSFDITGIWGTESLSLWSGTIKPYFSYTKNHVCSLAHDGNLYDQCLLWISGLLYLEEGWAVFSVVPEF